MRILMSQRDVRIPPNNFLFDALERSWYELLHKHTLIPVANIGAIDETIEFDCLVLTGGPDSIARHTTEDLLFAHALKLGKPIVGVCHGAFTVNDLTGGVNGRIADHTDTNHFINMEGSTHMVNSYHSQFIESMGPSMISIAEDLDGNTEAFQDKERPIYGIVWHPERMKTPVLPSVVKELLQVD
jgi:N5-(cytidine 5'-diphosphoramidyl)-L-glutamine hydrolase